MNCWQSALLATSVGFGFLATAANANVIAPYFQQNLVSDVPGLAPVTDPNLQKRRHGRSRSEEWTEQDFVT